MSNATDAVSASPPRFPNEFKESDLRFELLNPRLHRVDLLALAGDSFHIFDGSLSPQDLCERVTNTHVTARDATNGKALYGAHLASYDTPSHGRIFVACYCIGLANPSQIGKTKLHAVMGDVFVRKGTGARSGLFQLLLHRAESQADKAALVAGEPRRLALLLGQGKESTATSLMDDHQFVLTARNAFTVHFGRVTVLSKSYGRAL